MVRKYKLSEEEQEILDAFENNELVSVPNVIEEKEIAMIAASNYLKKTARINIRLKPQDLTQIKMIAAQEGMPYQTLISSILHKYAADYNKLDKAS